MTTYRGPNFRKPHTGDIMSDYDRDTAAVAQQRFWQAFYGSGLKHIKTSYTADTAASPAVETVTDDCGIDALEGLQCTNLSNSTIWNFDSHWMLDDGLKPMYLRFRSGQWYFQSSSTKSTYWNKFCTYWYIGEEIDVDGNVVYGNESTVYQVASDSGGGFDGSYQADGHFWQSSYSDGTLHVSLGKSSLVPDSYAGRHFFMERSRDEAGNIDEKGVVAGLSGSQAAATYGGSQTTAGYTFTAAREFGTRSQKWDSESYRRRCGLQHFPLTNDPYGNVATYENNVIPMSTMVARWGDKWWPSRAFVVVPKGYVHHQQDVLINVNGSPRKYASLCLNLGGSWGEIGAPHYNYGIGEQTLALWE